MRLIKVENLPENSRICIFGSPELGSRMRETILGERPDVEVVAYADFIAGERDGLKVWPIEQCAEVMIEVDHVLVASTVPRRVCDHLEKHGCKDPYVADNLFYYPPSDFTNRELEIIERVRPYTMTGIERLHGLIHAVDYVVDASLEGDIVECGVYRGGSMMCAALTLLDRDVNDRKLYLYDTFAGMTEPLDVDQNPQGEKASEEYKKTVDGDICKWCYADLESVQGNMCSTGYPEGEMTFVQGDILKTVPETISEKIALLRLDTDWYESTWHEMVHLFPRLVPGGVLILDDYGYWEGVKEAVDKYFAEKNIHVLLTRVDSCCRMAIKP